MVLIKVEEELAEADPDIFIQLNNDQMIVSKKKQS